MTQDDINIIGDELTLMLQKKIRITEHEDRIAILIKEVPEKTFFLYIISNEQYKEIYNNDPMTVVDYVATRYAIEVNSRE